MERAEELIQKCLDEVATLVDLGDDPVGGAAPVRLDCDPRPVRGLVAAR